MEGTSVLKTVDSVDPSLKGTLPLMLPRVAQVFNTLVPSITHPNTSEDFSLFFMIDQLFQTCN